MGYKKELDFVNEIDCFWSSKSKSVYPSLPEPYINLFFPINSGNTALIKGISTISDYLEVKTELFGVRLFLKGFYQLNIANCSQTNNKIQPITELSGEHEKDLIVSLEKTNRFEDRIEIFKTYYLNKKKNYTLSPLELNITDAFSYFISNYNDESVIRNCAEHLSISPRTVQRWFENNIGISPKKMSRIVRFHKGVYLLLSGNKNFYYDLGYFDQAHFIKEFNEFTGKSPEEYLKFLSETYKN